MPTNTRTRYGGVARFFHWAIALLVIAALALGLIADAYDSLEAGFWFTAAAMTASGFWVFLAMEETHASLNPAAKG